MKEGVKEQVGSAKIQGEHLTSLNQGPLKTLLQMPFFIFHFVFKACIVMTYVLEIVNL